MTSVTRETVQYPFASNWFNRTHVLLVPGLKPRLRHAHLTYDISHAPIVVLTVDFVPKDHVSTVLNGEIKVWIIDRDAIKSGWSPTERLEMFAQLTTTLEESIWVWIVHDKCYKCDGIGEVRTKINFGPTQFNDGLNIPGGPGYAVFKCQDCNGTGWIRNG